MVLGALRKACLVGLFAAAVSLPSSDDYVRRCPPLPRASSFEESCGLLTQYVPSYERGLERVVMHATPDLHWQESLLESLPSHTSALLLAPDYRKRDAVNVVERMGLENVLVASYAEGDVLENVWAQDLFETVETYGGRLVLLPAYHLHSKYYREVDSLQALLGRHGFAVHKASVWFEGGNVTSDYHDGKNLLFVGAKNLVDTSLQDLSGERLRAALRGFKADFGADSVVVLGKDQYLTQMFHLDQSFLITGPGEVVVGDLGHVSLDDVDEVVRKLRIADDDSRRRQALGYYTDERQFLDHYQYITSREHVLDIILRSQDELRGMHDAFEGLGYVVRRFPLDLWQNLHFQSYLNAVVFTDEESRQRSVLMPIFPDDEGLYLTSYRPNQEAVAFFEGLGLKVIPVRNRTWVKGGNVNCLLNAYE